VRWKLWIPAETTRWPSDNRERLLIAEASSGEARFEFERQIRFSTGMMGESESYPYTGCSDEGFWKLRSLADDLERKAFGTPPSPEEVIQRHEPSKVV